MTMNIIDAYSVELKTAVAGAVRRCLAAGNLGASVTVFDVIVHTGNSSLTAELGPHYENARVLIDYPSSDVMLLIDSQRLGVLHPDKSGYVALSPEDFVRLVVGDVADIQNVVGIMAPYCAGLVNMKE